MSANAATLGNAISIDFTDASNLYVDPAIINPPAVQLDPNGVFGMMEGDSDENGAIDQQDVARVVSAYFTRGSKSTDIDMNGLTNASDAQKTQPNQSSISHLPK